MKTEELELKRTCESCPEQYDVIYNGKRVGYIRYRSGLFTCQPVIEGSISNPYLIYKTDDYFENEIQDDKREKWLNDCLIALTDYWNNIQHY